MTTSKYSLRACQTAPKPVLDYMVVHLTPSEMEVYQYLTQGARSIEQVGIHVDKEDAAAQSILNALTRKGIVDRLDTRVSWKKDKRYQLVPGFRVALKSRRGA